VVDLAIINSLALCKEIYRSRTSRVATGEYMQVQRVDEDLEMMNQLKGSWNLPQNSEGQARLPDAATQ